MKTRMTSSAKLEKDVTSLVGEPRMARRPRLVRGPAPLPREYYERMEMVYQGLLAIGDKHQQREADELIGTDPWIRTLIGKRKK